MTYIPNDPGTEAEALSDWDEADYAGEVYESELSQSDIQEALKKIAAMRYGVSKAAKVGQTVPCGFCARPFVKSSYQQAFCCNKGRQNCKDSYWNLMNPRGIQA